MADQKDDTIHIKRFKIEYNGQTREADGDNYLTRKSFEEWQKKNPKIEVIDTKIQQEVQTIYTNILLVTYKGKEKTE